MKIKKLRIERSFFLGGEVVIPGVLTYRNNRYFSFLRGDFSCNQAANLLFSGAAWWGLPG